MSVTKILLDPSMENQEIWNHYLSHKTLKRKYLQINGVRTPVELSQDTLNLIKEKKKQIMKTIFERYHNAHRQQYNDFYRLRYHQKKAQNDTESQEERTIRIFKEDEEIQKLRRDEEEQNELRRGYEKRLDAIENHQLFLRSLTESRIAGVAPKNIGAREWFVGYIKNGNKLFTTEGEESRYVCKYYRGQWRLLLERGHLTKGEKDKLEYFARDFGAMDY